MSKQEPKTGKVQRGIDWESVMQGTIDWGLIEYWLKNNRELSLLFLRRCDSKLRIVEG